MRIHQNLLREFGGFQAGQLILAGVHHKGLLVDLVGNYAPGDQPVKLMHASQR
jgi:hypothetical protein